MEHAFNDVALGRKSIKGLPAAITPPWALETGGIHADNLQTTKATFETTHFPLVVCDLPPGVACDWGKPWVVQQKHTRWLHAEENNEFPPLPKNRSKQARKAIEQGLRLEPSSDLTLLLHLHQQVRERKSIPSDEAALERLLGWILTSPHQSSHLVFDEHNRPIASATFLHNKGRTVYAFGGQLRSKVSALATVLLIQQGLRDARQVGNRIFDFGGSSDAGVDRFYAEFGAHMEPRCRAILVKKWAKPLLRVLRPDLF